MYVCIAQKCSTHHPKNTGQWWWQRQPFFPAETDLRQGGRIYEHFQIIANVGKALKLQSEK